MIESECLKQIQALCREHMREADSPSPAVGRIMSTAQGRLFRMGAADGLLGGNE